jgi:hypothetical protein
LRTSEEYGHHGIMQSQAYAAIVTARESFKSLVDEWNRQNPYLREAEERLRARQGYADYRVETPIVYNRALDDIAEGDAIRIILVADNPGKNEQLAANNRYLVGQSGKIAEGWFRRELGIDFRREVVILNKTPVHTPKTAELGLLPRHAGIHADRAEALVTGSQRAMAEIAWQLYTVLRDSADGAPWPVLWISGVGELKRGGIFEMYRDEMSRRFAKADEDSLGGAWAFNHFSMNQFAVELKRKARPGKPLVEELERIGRENRARVFGL